MSMHVAVFRVNHLRYESEFSRSIVLASIADKQL
jgi:hypothetical protein